MLTRAPSQADTLYPVVRQHAEQGGMLQKARATLLSASVVALDSVHFRALLAGLLLSRTDQAGQRAPGMATATVFVPTPAV